ncbi:MAG: MBL fold metallo-hydrolase [Candidatus Lindowbacteria bacterium]|nr:MBL fold metallo-hydrolase [Candidatus Lindowbacteria bacterium]
MNTFDAVWYLNTESGSQGPYSADDLSARLSSGEITTEWYIWKEGFADWVTIASVPELLDQPEAIPKLPSVQVLEQAAEIPLSASSLTQEPEVSTKAAKSKSTWLKSVLVVLLLASAVSAGFYHFYYGQSGDQSESSGVSVIEEVEDNLGLAEGEVSSRGKSTEQVENPTGSFVLASNPFSEKDKVLEVVFLNIGQGDAILLKLPNKKYVLIDAGPSERVGLIPYLRYAGVKKFRAVVMSHPHQDHIGGINYVLNSFPVEEVYDCGKAHTTKVYRGILDTIDKLGIDYVNPKAGDNLDWDPDVKIKVLHPDEPTYSNMNDNSIVLKITYGDVSFIFTGDAEEKAERTILSNFKDELSAQILKVGHHGSRTSSSRSFVKAVGPKIAVISCGTGNKFKHPQSETLDTLEEFNVETHRTDLEGYVTIRTDGKKTWMSSSHVAFPAIKVAKGKEIKFSAKSWNENAVYHPKNKRGGITLKDDRVVIVAQSGENFWPGIPLAPFLAHATPKKQSWTTSTEVEHLSGGSSDGGLILYQSPRSFITFGISNRGNVTLNNYAAGSKKITSEAIIGKAKRLAIRRNRDHFEFLVLDSEEGIWHTAWKIAAKDIPMKRGKTYVGPYVRSKVRGKAKFTFSRFEMTPVPREKSSGRASEGLVAFKANDSDRYKNRKKMEIVVPSKVKLLKPIKNVRMKKTFDAWVSTRDLTLAAQEAGVNKRQAEAQLLKLYTDRYITRSDLVDNAVFAEIKKTTDEVGTTNKYKIQSAHRKVDPFLINVVIASLENQKKRIKKTVTVGQRTLDEYVGSYKVTTKYIIKVFRKGSDVFASFGGNDSLEVFPEAKSVFYLKHVDSQIEFTRDANRKVTGIIYFWDGKAWAGKKTS